MGNLKNKKKESTEVGNFVPREAIETSENARKNQDNAKRIQATDPYNEDRVSVRVPSSEEVDALTPDDTVNPG